MSSIGGRPVDFGHLICLCDKSIRHRSDTAVVKDGMTNEATNVNRFFIGSDKNHSFLLSFVGYHQTIISCFSPHMLSA